MFRWKVFLKVDHTIKVFQCVHTAHLDIWNICISLWYLHTKVLLPNSNGA